MHAAPLIAALLILSTLITNAAKVVITGMDAPEVKRFSGLLKPRLEFIKSRPATSWRADDASFLLHRLLIRFGYADSDVVWSIQGNDTILLKVTPGARFHFGNIIADRLCPLDQTLLEDYFFQPLIETELTSKEKAPYQPDYTQKGAENIHNYLKSIGYWSSTVAVKKTVIDRRQQQVNVYLALNEGRRHTLLPPQFSGISESDRLTLDLKCRKFIGKTATTERITRIHSILTDYFSERGNHFAKIEPNAIHKMGTTTLSFAISPGERYRLKRVTVAGQQRTENRRIARFYNQLKGQYYHDKEGDKATARLLNTGAFTNVTTELVPTNDQQLNMKVTVEEGPDKAVRSYAGLGSFEGFILGSSYTDLNFAGKLLRFNARGEVSGRGLLGEVGLTEPFFVGEPIRLTTRAFSMMRQYDSYDKSEHGLSAAFTWEPSQHLSTRLFTSTSYVTADSTSLTKLELGPPDYIDTRIGIEQDFDFRDNQVLPTKGFHATLLAELGTITGDAATSYFHTDVKLSYRHAIDEDQRLVGRFNFGAIYPSESLDLPIDRRIFAGGADSVRSFDERTLGPRSLSGGPLGGEAYWETSIEFVQSFTKTISGVLFYDSGQVYQYIDDFSFNNPSHALGLGLRFDLPIGPVRLEYGYNLNRKAHEPSGAFHFAIGTTF